MALILPELLALGAAKGETLAAEGAEIYWGDETSLSTSDPRGSPARLAAPVAISRLATRGETQLAEVVRAIRVAHSGESLIQPRVKARPTKNIAASARCVRVARAACRQSRQQRQRSNQPDQRTDAQQHYGQQPAQQQPPIRRIDFEASQHEQPHEDVHRSPDVPHPIAEIPPAVTAYGPNVFDHFFLVGQLCAVDL